MRLPTERTIVFAGVETRDKPMLERAGVDAVMCSFEKLKTNKRFQQACRDGFAGNPITYLDSGVFTLMRRAGVTLFAPTREAGTNEQIRAAVQKLAKQYAAYLQTDLQHWDWVIELDTDEVFGPKHFDLGVELADKLRAYFKRLVGDKLLPVWHATPGAEERWQKMIREYPYVCISPSRASGGKSNRRNHSMIRGMVRDAHAQGTKVHLLGASTLEYFETFEVDSMDSSGWSAGVRWGELKVTRGKVFVPKFETKNRARRAIEHSRLEQLATLCEEWGFTLEQVRDDYLIRIEAGIRLLELRQQELRRKQWKPESLSV